MQYVGSKVALLVMLLAIDYLVGIVASRLNLYILYYIGDL